MTLDEFIKYFRYSTANGFSFAESQQIANYLEELKKLREENKSLKKDIEAYDEIIESEIGFGEGEE